MLSHRAVVLSCCACCCPPPHMRCLPHGDRQANEFIWETLTFDAHLSNSEHDFATQHPKALHSFIHDTSQVDTKSTHLRRGVEARGGLPRDATVRGVPSCRAVVWHAISEYSWHSHRADDSSCHVPRSRGVFPVMARSFSDRGNASLIAPAAENGLRATAHCHAHAVTPLQAQVLPHRAAALPGEDLRPEAPDLRTAARAHIGLSLDVARSPARCWAACSPLGLSCCLVSPVHDAWSPR